MAEIYDKKDIKDFTAWLASYAVNEAYYKTHPQGGFLYKRDMNVMQYLFFSTVSSTETCNIIEVLENRLNQFRMSPADVHNRIFYTFVFVSDFTQVSKKEFTQFLKTQLDKNINANILSEFILFDFEQCEYSRIGGGRILDPLLRKVLKEAAKPRQNNTVLVIKKKDEISDIRVREQSKILYYNMAAILAVNLFIFIADAILEARYGVKPIFEFGMQHNQAVLDGEWWRLITSVFIHADSEHIMGNMLTLVIISRTLQGFYTGTEYWILYISSGIAGSLATVLFMPEYVVSVGASGAIMGLGGVLIYRMFFGKSARAFRRLGSFFSIGIIIAYNLVAGLFSKQINNFAHFSGFFTGFIMAWAIDIIRIKRKKKNITRKPA